uniref:Putative methyltransferase n=1 Tax=viral metagenome TaxID=1070528 RepID=A0A6M3JKV3_9ZZZZ
MNKGFTLIELIMVIVIGAILVAVAVPYLMGKVPSNNKKLEYALGSDYNKKDVEIFMKENNLIFEGDLAESEVLQNRYKKWIKKELEK